MKKYNLTCSTNDENLFKENDLYKKEHLDKLSNFITNIEFENKSLRDNIENLVNGLKIDSLRKRVFITSSTIGMVNLISKIPLSKIDAMEKFMNKNGFLKSTSIMSGGMMGDISLFTLGIAPYVSSNLIIDLLSKLIPTLDENFEGEYGRTKKERLVKSLTFFIGLLNGLSISYGIIDGGILIALGMAIGSVLLGNIAEFITNRGIGKGTDVLVVNGVLSNIKLGNLNLINLLTLPALSKMVSKFNQAKVNVPVINVKKKEDKIPFKILNNGMMPMIMSCSLFTVISLFIPSLINEYSNIILIVQSVLLYAYNFLLSSIFVDVNDIDNFTKRRCMFVKGKRPGKETKEYLVKVRNNANIIGSLGLIAMLILPVVFGTKIVSISGLFVVISCLSKIMSQIESEIKSNINTGFLKDIS